MGCQHGCLVLRLCWATVHEILGASNMQEACEKRRRRNVARFLRFLGLGVRQRPDMMWVSGYNTSARVVLPENSIRADLGDELKVAGVVHPAVEGRLRTQLVVTDRA